MKKMAFISIVVLLLSTVLAHADLTVYGEVQKFNPKTGRVVLITKTEGKAQFTIPRNTPVFMHIKGKEIQENWDFLKYNMMPGTKVKLSISKDTVTKLVVLEVPR